MNFPKGEPNSECERNIQNVMLTKSRIVAINIHNVALILNPLMPSGAFNIWRPRDCVSRHNGGTSGAPLKPLRVDGALRALSTLRGLRGAPEVPPLCRETQSLGQQMLKEPLDINGLISTIIFFPNPTCYSNYTVYWT